MSIKDLFFALDMSNEGFQQEFKDDMIKQSYNAWQINETIKAIITGKSKGTKFNDYLKALNLLDKEKVTKMNPEMIKKTKEDALNNAKNILNIDRKGRKHG